MMYNQRYMEKKLKKQRAKAGSEGGKKAAANLTPEQRKERARKAVAAREAKRKTDNKR